MPSKPRTRLAAALTAAAAIGATSLTATSATADPVIPKASGNVVVEWNRTLLSLVQTPGAQPATIHPTRDFAIMSAAVSDAVTATDPHHSRDPLMGFHQPIPIGCGVKFLQRHHGRTPGTASAFDISLLIFLT